MGQVKPPKPAPINHQRVKSLFDGVEGVRVRVRYASGGHTAHTCCVLARWAQWPASALQMAWYRVRVKARVRVRVGFRVGLELSLGTRVSNCRRVRVRA